MNVFLTGGTGFLGQYILAELLAASNTVWALYRDEMTKDKTMLFLSSLGGPWGKGRLHWIEGDLLDCADFWAEWCRTYPGLENVDTLIHSAASLRFKLNEAGEPLRTNVEGVRVLKRLVKCFPMQVHLISTAYVCGLKQDEVIYEQFHPRGCFANIYEQSKWEAENIWAGQATIFRPAVLVGHSQTGHASSFTGWYIIIKAVYLLDQFLKSTPQFNRLDLQMEIPADPETTINLVPVDYAARSIVKIIDDPLNHNKIYHITHPQPPTFQWSHDLISKLFGFGGIKFIGKDATLPEPRSDLHALINNQVKVLLPYLANNPLFDRTNTDLAIPEIELPSINEALIKKLIDYAITEWGRNIP